MNSRMLRILLPAVLLLAFSALLSQDVGAASFTLSNPWSSVVNSSATGNVLLYISINNTDSSANITQVNMTLYGFTFNGSTLSEVTNANFSSSSITQLGWVNYTPAGFIAAGGNAKNFLFGVNVTLTPGSYNITVNVTDTSGVYNATNITYTVVDNPVYQITFSTSSSMSQSTNLIQNLSYLVNITNTGSLRKTYNLTVVNCSNTSQAGVGILNQGSVVLNASEIRTIQLNVSNSAAGLYSSCIMAKHYNGTADPSNVTSDQNSVILNSGFYPDINVTYVNWTSTGGNSPFAGGNITVNATVSNLGHFNFTGSISIYLLWDVVVNTTVTVVDTSLGNGTSYVVGFSNITGITNGLHNLTVWADASGSVTESNETNNNKTAQVFVGYNVTALNVTGNSSVNAYSNSTVNISVYVYYPNATAVTGLTKYNFSVYDQQTGVTFNSANAAFNSSFTNGTGGFYWFNITTPAIVNATATLPGVHNLTVTASRSESEKNYSGNSSGLDYYYLLVPKLTVTLSALSTVNEGDPRGITISVTNTGTDSIYNVTLTPSLVSTYLSGGSISCIPILTIPNILVAQTGILSCSATVVAQEVSDDTSTSYVVTATGSYNYSGTVTTYSTANFIDLLVMNTGTADTGDTGGGTTAKSCTTDAQCSDNESCNSAKKCATISCANGEIIDHMCIPVYFKINITAFDSAIRADSGASNLTKVTVKNSGTNKFTAKLEVTINNVTATVSPASYSLGAGESYQFTVNFTVPSTTTIGTFSGNLKAYVSTSTGSYDSKGFTFTVLPNAETESGINVSYQELTSLLSDVIANLSRMKASGRYNQTVLASIESLITAANATLLQVKSSIDSNDYVSAQYLISQVNASINNAQSQMGSAPQVTGGLIFNPGEYGIWFWVAVVVIIIFVVGFFIYMFYPSSHAGYHPEKGYALPSGKEGLGAKIKRLFKRKKKSPAASISSFAHNVAEQPKAEKYETFHYSEGYKKENSYDYQYSKEGGFLSKLRKNKDKKPPQMHIDQFSAAPVAEQKKE